MIIRISHKKMQQQIKMLIKNGIPFHYDVTNQRQVIRSSIGNYMNKESQFPSNELNFIKQVKRHIVKNEIYKDIPNRFKKDGSKKKIKYFHYNRRLKSGDVLNNVYEIDLKSAYWETAWKMGLLSPELYEKGKSVSKKSRLAAIGALAKTVTTYYFDGKEEHEPETSRSKETEFLWDTICHKVGKLLYQVSRECGSNFIFFWVDAMFVHKDAVESVKRMFKEAGYEFSVEKCKYIQFREKDLIVDGKGKWGEIDGEKVWITKRPFPYKKAMSETEILNLASGQ